MCGIAGYFGSQELGKSQRTLALKRLDHRGPDGQGVYVKTTRQKKNLYLLHTRLSIIDLNDHANQPMKVDNHILAFNGELYNYKESKIDLLKNNPISFQTFSDTEVLLKMIAVKGISQALKEAEGMWALAYYDESTEILSLSRDRFGEKPLFYLETDHGLFFASEIQALFALSGQRHPINQEKLLTYLFMGYRSLYKDDDTFFQNIKSLKPQSILEVRDGRITNRQRYWAPKIDAPAFSNTTEAVKEIKEKLICAVDLRLRSDVPIAFCMSGGIDSLSLISIAKKVFKYDVQGFTIANQDSRYDENTLVDHAVKELEIQHTYVRLNQHHFLDTLKMQIKKRAAPVATISYYVHYLLMAQIKASGYKVSISGTGADELFTGYYDHFLFHLASCEGNSYSKNLAYWKSFVKPFIRNPLFQNENLFSVTPTFRNHLHQDYSDYSDYAKCVVNTKFQEKFYHPQGLRNRMLNELFEEVVPVILGEDDQNAMACSIENRSPFLDSVLLESSLRIPPELLIQEGYAKYILRAAVKDILPEQIRTNHRKVGFNASLSELLALKDSSVVNYLFERNSPIFLFIDREKIMSLFLKESPPEKFLFNFICAKIFLDQFYSTD